MIARSHSSLATSQYSPARPMEGLGHRTARPWAAWALRALVCAGPLVGCGDVDHPTGVDSSVRSAAVSDARPARPPRAEVSAEQASRAKLFSAEEGPAPDRATAELMWMLNLNGEAAGTFAP
ncbi:MAG TPA: hypothetical protein VFU71_00570 [Burkholderiaceae bacterium]|nr:hypothetical protein [Burkholderiaceae bacterium]